MFGQSTPPPFTIALRAAANLYEDANNLQPAVRVGSYDWR
jgi:hypothetical protein